MNRIPVIISVLIVMIIGTGLSLHLSAQDAQGREINSLYRKGLDAYKAKDYKLFLECFQKLYKYRPNNRMVLYNLAGGHALNKQPKKSIFYLKKLIRVNANLQILKDSDFDILRDNPEFKAIAKKIKDLHKPLVKSKEAFRLKEKDLHIEGLAYDSKTGRFFLSSIHKRKILVREKDGTIKEFTTQGQDGLDCVLGLRADVKNRVLWATSSAFPQMTGFKKSDEGRTAVFKYNMDTGKLIKKYTLHKEGERHNFDEVILHPNGDVFLSDTRNIYVIPTKTGKLEPLLYNDPLMSVQGMDFCDNGKKLVVADWTLGMFLVDIGGKKIITKITPPKDFSLTGIDGLYHIPGTKSWIAIQNGLNPMRVVRLTFNDDFSKVKKYQLIERANPLFNEPTLGVLVNKDFYFVANSQWKAYTRDGNIFPMEKLQEIIILKVKL